ncbi:ATP-binding protein [Candidatus Magnetaquicoccus inordinatus]|uniref:ATP-binding protein n=1 Tax=Candidatus Magnetaquicoccus inordinatus TaxID=2496818 RepID=UPI00187D208A|nr:ATP-binding protein [Candidatus Magnetaquicoccus inordinatus]
MFLLLSLIPALMVGYISFDRYKHTIETIRLRDLSNIAYYKAAAIEALFSSLISHIKVAQQFYNIKTNLPILIQLEDHPNHPMFLSAKKKLDSQLQRMQSILMIHDIQLVNPAGKKVYSSNPAHQNDYLLPLAAPEQMRFPHEKEGLYLSDVFINDRESNQQEMRIGVPIFDFNDRFIGTIVFEVNMARIYKLMQNTMGLGHTGETLIGKQIGQHIVYLNPLRHDASAALNRTILIGNKIGGPIQEAIKKKTGSGQLLDYRGIPVIAAWRYLPLLGWGMVSKIDTHEAFAEIRNLQQIVIFILGITLLLVIALAFSITQAIVRPIDQLSKDVRIIGSGNFNHTVGAYGIDEFGQLSHAFNRMAEDLKKITISRDEMELIVSERTLQLKRSTAELLEAQKTSDRAKHLEEIGTLAAIVAHELRNPLSAMSIAAYNIKRKANNPQLDKHLKTIEDKVIESDRIINNLLSYARIQSPQYEAVRINHVILECFEPFEHVAVTQHNVSCIKRLSATKQLMIDADPYQLKEVMSNILENALDARPATGGKIVVSTDVEAGYVRIHIQDNGSGISPENIERVFAPFFSTKSKGTGLGLAVCQQIIHLHEGMIQVRSEPGIKTVVRISLPIKKAASSASKSDPATA